LDYGTFIQARKFDENSNQVIQLARSGKSHHYDAQGLMDTPALIKIIGDVAALAVASPNCKVLIDCIDSECTVNLKRIEALLTQLQPGFWPVQSRVALISSLKNEEYVRLSDVSTLLASNGFRVAVFQDAQAAAEWLKG
jgi:hypothetical protein